MKRKERREIEVTSTYDIETEDWDIPVLCGQYHSVKGYRETRDVEVFAKWLLSPGFHWAHNGGKFDALAIMDVWRAMGEKVTGVMAGNRLIAVRARDSVLCDSYALWQCSLAEMTADRKEGGKLDFPLDCICGACAGYCAIRKSMSPEDYDKVSEYLQRDCVALFDKLTQLIEFAEQHDLDLALTLGASAYASASRELGLEPDTHSLREHKFRRSAYYGGRTQVFRLGDWGPFNDADITSAYVDAIANNALPIGQPRTVCGRQAQSAYVAGRPGIYSVVLNVPEQFIPPLPMRAKGRLHYPWGTWQGIYTLPALHLAEEFGAKIEAFSDARIFDREEIVFRPWVERLIALRLSVGKKTSFGWFLKTYLAALTGKLGARPEKLTLLINPERIKEGDRVLAPDIFAREKLLVDDCARPIWAAYCTSMVAAKLRRKMSDGAISCDTDGFNTLDDVKGELGSGLGQWEVERWPLIRTIAPKCYAIFDGDGRVLKSRAKGVPLKPGEAPVIGKSYVLPGIKGAKSIGRRAKFFEAKGKNGGHRVVNQRTGDRILLANGLTRPPHTSEIED